MRNLSAPRVVGGHQGRAISGVRRSQTPAQPAQGSRGCLTAEPSPRIGMARLNSSEAHAVRAHSGQPLEPAITQTREILRQASVALGQRPVWLWEVTEPQRLVPRLSSDPEGDARPPDVDLYSTIERWHIPVARGSLWLGSRVWADGPWVIAPVRSRPPAPPPTGRERRSRERITLELAGLCVGLENRAGAGEGFEPNALPTTILHELGNPLAAAHAALQLVIESVGRGSAVPAPARVEILEELGLVNDDLERAVDFLRLLHKHLRDQSTP